MREIFTQNQAEFAAEMKEKQEILDKTNAALKESASALAEEKRKLEELQAHAREKEELEQKIKNLRRSASEIRNRLKQAQPNMTPVQEHIQIGEADRGLNFEGNLGVVEQLFPTGMFDPSMPLTADHQKFLSVLERGEVLSGRVQAYQQHNSNLDQQAKALKSRSTELEERYKKIISLCTGADVEKVDSLLDGLMQAVISEQKETSSSLELGRVRDFLRLVQGSEA